MLLVDALRSNNVVEPANKDPILAMTSVDQVTNDAAGKPLSTESKVLETGAAASQVTASITFVAYARDTDTKSRT